MKKEIYLAYDKELERMCPHELKDGKLISMFTGTETELKRQRRWNK